MTVTVAATVGQLGSPGREAALHPEKRERAFSLRSALARATADQHAAAEAALLPFFTGRPAGHLGFLRAMAAVVAPLERALDDAGVESILEDWGVRRRTVALRTDLASLGSEMPAALSVPTIRGEAQMLGVLYVLEGSRLGARILARLAASADDPRVSGAMRFLGHGEDTRLWPDFLARLEASDAARSRIADCIDMARRAFALFSASAVTPLTSRADGD